MLLRADVAHEMRGAVGVAIGMAIEARDAAVRFFRAAVAGHVELLLRKRREQEPQSIELLGIQDAVENFHEIVDGHAPTLADIAQIRPGGEKDGRGKFRQQMIGQIEIEIEPGQVALLLFLQLVDLKLREDHPALGMIRVRQRQKTRGPDIFVADLLRRHPGQLVPCRALWQAHAHALLHRLFARHRHAGRRVLAQVVALGEHVVVLLCDGRFLRRHAVARRLEILLRHHRHVARRRRFRRRGGGFCFFLSAGAEGQGEREGGDGCCFHNFEGEFATAECSRVLLCGFVVSGNAVHVAQSIAAAIATMPRSSVRATVESGTRSTVPMQAHSTSSPLRSALNTPSEPKIITMIVAM